MSRVVYALAICLAALPALAQDAERDWDMVRNPRQNVVMAYTQFDNGLGISVRCVDGGYEAIIGGLPPAGRTATRPLRIAFGDETLHEQRWNVAINDTMAVGDFPAPFARKLRQGGRLRILIPGAAEGGRNLMYDLSLPTSSASIDETLTTCGRPLTDARDAAIEDIPESGLPASITWAKNPEPSYPSSTRYARGFAVVSCLSQPNGTLQACQIETEHPRDGGFGEAALRGTRQARLQNQADATAPVPVRQIAYRTNFIIEGYQTREESQAQRDARRREREARATAASKAE